MKIREPRRRVHIPARMRCGAVWSDICIKNMSSRGLMAETAYPLLIRSYVEIRRGNQLIIGRVVWTAGGRFGLRSQDRMDIDAVINEPRLESRPARPGLVAAQPGERRREPDRRSADRLAADVTRSRTISAALQFVIIVGMGMAAALFIAGTVYDALSAPLKKVESRLAQ